MFEIVIGLVAYVLIYAALQWLLPNFNNTSSSSQNNGNSTTNSSQNSGGSTTHKSESGTEHGGGGQLLTQLMQRIIIVYNPRSSRFSDVKKEVLNPAKNLEGHMVGKYEVEKTNLDANIAKLSKLIKDKDLIIAAGGDATGIIASNSILESGKDATLAVLPYGNFNDLSRTLGTKKFEDIFNTTNKLYPLEIIVDGKLFRYATCYVTIGMTAEAVKLYDTPTMRRKLKTDFGRKISSYTELAGWYFRHRHKKQFIPEFKLNGVLQHKDTSDYAALNGRSMARIMKGGEDFKDPKIVYVPFNV